MLNDDYCISIEHLKASKSDIEELKPIQTLLAKTGFTLTLTENCLTIKLDPEKYNRQLRLNAGRKIRLSNYKYSELIYMMYFENLTDYEIEALKYYLANKSDDNLSNTGWEEGFIDFLNNKK